MIYYDPIYGRCTVPEYLERLIHTPEVRRLSQIRLLNALSPSLATLGEIRRFSHTLGVLRLLNACNLEKFSADERKALSASVLLHDVGTPPFAHLFEYHLRDIKGWSHESAIRSILWGTHVPENKAHQIFGNRTIEFLNVLRSSRISLDIVEQIITRKHPLSQLLFGTIDLDNVDNVCRMAWCLGLPVTRDLAPALAASVTLTRDGVLKLDEECRPVIQEWARLRRMSYDIIVFDPPTVAAQAVLSEAAKIALTEGLLDEHDWCLSDEQFIETLLAADATKGLIGKEYLGRLPPLLFSIQLAGTLSSYGIENRETAKVIVEKCVQDEIGEGRVLAYAFIDRGTFEKQLTFHDNRSGCRWDEGSTSCSIVLYAFSRSSRPIVPSKCLRAAERLLDRLGASSEQRMRLQLGNVNDNEHPQKSFNF